jgi:RNA polymerase sigma-70 factor, ECF subfamily
MTGEARPSEGLKNELIAAIPKLRAFAVSLSGSADRADDLVQETITKALQNLGSFEAGSNMIAWLLTILRNTYYSEIRRRRREVSDPDGIYAATIVAKPEQLPHLEYRELLEALQKLPPDQREALILVGASGLSYEEAAKICKCAVGTVKSRISRARQRLTQALEMDKGDAHSEPSARSPRSAAGRDEAGTS